jgi:hypothetical protein
VCDRERALSEKRSQMLIAQRVLGTNFVKETDIVLSLGRSKLGRMMIKRRIGNFFCCCRNNKKKNSFGFDFTKRKKTRTQKNLQNLILFQFSPPPPG